ncbi:MAG: hypothetical protein EB002_07045 [Betaproteobacteria bacterium]|nr:hypothetical protein [Betaproteobacteria bacterium]
MERSSSARASELLFLARHSDQPGLVIGEFERFPAGGVYDDGRMRFEWGNIKTLVEGKLHSSAQTTRITERAKSLYHLDRLGIKRRLEVEKLHSLPSGAISGGLGSVKADVLVIDQDGKPYYVSFKEKEGFAKLGQVSAKTQYGLGTLQGGLSDLDIESLGVPGKFDYSQTALTANEFSKATKRDRILAFYKKQHAAEWDHFVRRRNEKAASELREFAEIMCKDRGSFVEFVGTTLAGSLRNSRDFYVVIGDQVICLSPILSHLSSFRWRVTTCDSSTQNKHAVLLSIGDNDNTYTLTRIEQSFEGKEADVIQTKGIIYHCQQHPRDGANYKKLLLDLRNQA